MGYPVDSEGIVTPPMARRREAYQRALQETLSRLAALLSADPTVERLILFGFYAHGRADLLTDLDLVVIQKSELDFLVRMVELYRQIGPLLVDADILVYTPEEWEIVRDMPFGRQILQEGEGLYKKVTS